MTYLPKSEIINGLCIERECVSRDCDRDCSKCDLVQDRDWLLSVYDNAIIILKEQEEQEPIKLPALPTMPKKAWRWGCPKCEIDIGYMWKFCPRCGQKIRWKFLGASA